MTLLLNVHTSQVMLEQRELQKSPVRPGVRGVHGRRRGAYEARYALGTTLDDMHGNTVMRTHS